MNTLYVILSLIVWLIRVVFTVIFHLVYSFGMYVLLVIPLFLAPAALIRFFLNLIPFAQDYSFFGLPQNIIALIFCWVVVVPAFIYYHIKVIYPIIIAHPLTSYWSLKEELLEILD